VAAGPSAFQSAFTTLGQLAMQEPMTDGDAAVGMGILQKYIDAGKVRVVLDGKQG
jgi:hypothetical protein